MKIQFDEITVGSRTKNIDIFDGEKDIVINKKDFDRVKTIEGAIPISKKCIDLNTLKIKGSGSSYNVSFTKEQQDIIINSVIEVESMTFLELKNYNFNPDRKYKVHINQDCMNNAEIDGYPLPTFLKSKTNIVEVEIDNDVTSISDAAFSGCNKLASITIPEGVTSIGQSTFYGCSSLTEINIPNSVTSIGQWAFYRCSGLTSVNIGKGVTYIGRYAFDECSILSYIAYNGTKEQWQSIPNSYLNIDCTVYFTNGSIRYSRPW